ncbi:MAG: ABC-2 family transporter protein [Bdellovibrio sp.]
MRPILKKAFVNFCRRNLAFAKLAAQTNLEYRLNFFVDAIVQPIITAFVEILLWFSLFHMGDQILLAGFDRANYIAYALWASFVARITTNWMYESRMMIEIETGSLNAILVRPVSFFEFYLAQFMGYKMLTTVISLIVPILVVFWMELPTDWSRAPVAGLLVIYHLVFVHLLSFCVVCMAFHMTKVHSLTVAKNLALWFFSGELLPLDILPKKVAEALSILPFSNAVYTPVGYLLGRVSSDDIARGFVSSTLGILSLSFLALGLWHWGLRTYSGTGA